MTPGEPFSHVSETPTRPATNGGAPQFDVEDLYRGPLATATTGTAAALDEKLRQAYFWVVNQAVISPHYDIEYDDGPSETFYFGDSKVPVHLPSGQSYSSFILLPFLTFATRGRCLFVGGPGRGKTQSAVLMGILAGYSVDDVRRGMQHGHPQMTVADLLGNPLPADLVGAQSMDDIRIAWRHWLSMRVKIIDEYNRIPTRTQSALLTVMGDGYAELLDHVYECPPSAWYLTANDDIGGGTYPVIEALRDRIDVVVMALAFNSRFLGDLLLRVEQSLRPEDLVPKSLMFTPDECDELDRQVRAVSVPADVRRRLEFFASQFEFCETAGDQLEYRTKDTVRLAGGDYHLVASRDTGRDVIRDIGVQTSNGLSVRSLMTILHYSKALAYFRGQEEVSLEDVRHIVPFALRHKLAPDAETRYLQEDANQMLASDRVSWLRRLFDLASAEYDRLDLDRDDPVADLKAQMARGLDGVTTEQARAQLVQIERLMAEWSAGKKLYGNLYDDLLQLKYIHQRYTNYLAWLEWAS